MRGRDTYYAIRPFLIVLFWITRVMPRCVCEVLLVCLRHFPTRIGIALRYVLLKRLLKKCGENVVLFDGAYILHPGNAEIGDNVSIHEMCYLDAAAGLTIGAHSAIAHDVTIMTTEHDCHESVLIKDARYLWTPVSIGEDVWIGAGAKILGVAIGDHSVIGAGAVVTRDIPPRSVAVGIPAKVIRQRDA
jgi:acetyltransferase-like isoleucine patch superfamily enzyme